MAVGLIEEEMVAMGKTGRLTLRLFLVTCFVLISMSLHPALLTANEETQFLEPVEHSAVVPDGWTPIYSAEDLNKLQGNGSFILMNDIDASSLGIWEPAGDEYWDGELDGNGYTISNLVTQVIDDGDGSSGLFNTLRGDVFDLGLINCSPAYSGKGPLTFGALAANSTRGTVTNCYSRVNLEIAQDMMFADSNSTEPYSRGLSIGAFIGQKYGYDGATFSHCYTDGSIAVSAAITNDSILTNIGEMYFSDGPEPSISCYGLSGARIEQSLNSCDIRISATATNEVSDEHRNDGAGAYIHAAGLYASKVIQSENEADITADADVNVYTNTGHAGSDLMIYGAESDGGRGLEDVLNSGNISCEFNVSSQEVVGGACFAEVAGIRPLGYGEPGNMPVGAVRCLNIGDVTFETNVIPTDMNAVLVNVAGIPAFWWSPDDPVEAVQDSYQWDGANIEGPLTLGEWDWETDTYPLVSSVDTTVPSISTAEMASPSTFSTWDFETIWRLEEGDSHPELRCLERNGSLVETSSAADASDPLAQLVACMLTEFNVGSGFDGKTVDDYLNSDAFVDRKLWTNDSSESTNSYGDVISQILGGYSIVNSRLFGYDGAPYISLKHPSSGEIILAFKTDGPASLEEGSQQFFNDSADVLNRISKMSPASQIYLTGAGLGGIAVAYLSNTQEVEASTFNSGALIGVQLAALVQAPVFAEDTGFRGIDDLRCKNYYGEPLANSLGYDEGLVACSSISVNPLGGDSELCSLLERGDDGYRLRDSTQYIPDEMKTYTTVDLDELSKVIEKYIKDYIKGAAVTGDFVPDVPSISSLLNSTTEVSLGTMQRDTKKTGFESITPWNALQHQIGYTGDAQSDLFMGGTSSDVLVAGEGKSTLSGGTGSDVYYIGDGANVDIHDTDSRNTKTLFEGLLSVFKLIGNRDMLAFEGFYDGLVELLSKTNRDTVVITSCSFDQMDVQLERNLFNTDYYVITAGMSTVRIPRRMSAKNDFYIVDASGKSAADGMELGELYRQKNGATVYGGVNRLGQPSIPESENLVSFTFSGVDIKVRICDKQSNEVIATLSSSEQRDCCLDNGTFVSLSDAATIEGTYDASAYRIELFGGICDRAITNNLAGELEGDIRYRDELKLADYDYVEIKVDDTVELVGVIDGVPDEPVDTEKLEKPWDNAGSDSEMNDDVQDDMDSNPDNCITEKGESTQTNVQNSRSDSEQTGGLLPITDDTGLTYALSFLVCGMLLIIGSCKLRRAKARAKGEIGHRSEW